MHSAMFRPPLVIATIATTLAAVPLFAAGSPPSLSGIHPHLTMFNEEGECGTGAVVPWADRLWIVTYAPHKPLGSTDKLYEITPDLRQIIRPESIGGTPANRLIHEESGQLFIGPRAIDSAGKVRTIPYTEMWFFLENGHTTGHIFPDGFSAYWIRFVSDEDTIATAQLIYR